jgi:hypothetical protein
MHISWWLIHHFCWWNPPACVASPSIPQVLARFRTVKSRDRLQAFSSSSTCRTNSRLSSCSLAFWCSNLQLLLIFCRDSAIDGGFAPQFKLPFEYHYRYYSPKKRWNLIYHCFSRVLLLYLFGSYYKDLYGKWGWWPPSGIDFGPCAVLGGSTHHSAHEFLFRLRWAQRCWIILERKQHIRLSSCILM